MVKDIVKTAVLKKMDCKTRNDLISPAEFSFGVGLAMSIMESPDSLKQIILTQETVVEVKQKILSYVQARRSEFQSNHRINVLFTMIEECKIDGIMTEELRELIQMGLAGRV